MLVANCDAMTSKMKVDKRVLLPVLPSLFCNISDFIQQLTEFPLRLILQISNFQARMPQLIKDFLDLDLVFFQMICEVTYLSADFSFAIQLMCVTRYVALLSDQVVLSIANPNEKSFALIDVNYFLKSLTWV